MAGSKQRRQADGLRIGIFAGAFDPVHSGHIAFALQAMAEARLDEVVFVPERQPRGKPAVEHFAHRVAMLNRAALPYQRLSVLELADRNLSVVRTWPQLQVLFGGAAIRGKPARRQFVLLMGSDVVYRVQQWPHIGRLLQSVEMVVGVRAEHSLPTIDRLISGWPQQPPAVTLLNSFAPDVSSAHIRQVLRSGKVDGAGVKGLLASVKQYAHREWLYVSPGAQT